MQKGFTIVEILIVLTIIGVLLAIAIPELHEARTRAVVSAVVADAKTIHHAFKQYMVDHSGYYPSMTLNEFEPLRSQGAYNGTVSRLLLNGSADGFDSPDDVGTNQEFWLEMTLAFDPTVRILVADSDNAPIGGGNWYDGVYRFKNGVLEPL